jgi:Ser/Thr protein kinase RdoA (MazF antagonist)
VRLPPATAWPAEAYEAAARRLGRAQGELAVAPPREAWLSRRWLRAYVRRRRALVDEHGSGPTRTVWESREDVLRRIESGPQTLCHLDLHPRNVFGDAGETVLVDWAYCGVAAVGEDATTLVLDSLLDGFVPAGEGPAFERALWRAYSEGLRDVGWDGEVDAVRYAHAAGAAVKYAWIPAAVAARRGPWERWARVVPLLDALAEEALG